MQGSIAWVPPSGKLGEILEETRRRAYTIDRGPTPGPGGQSVGARASLRDALRTSSDVAVIAEVKRRSPSKGVINAGIESGAQAFAYDRGGAAAISVLTEPTFFGGSISDLQSAAHRTALPLLKKDFHIVPEQIEEAKNSGASALLIIARALPPELLSTMIRTAEKSFEAVVEVRNERELELALENGATMIGVNSRDLETLAVDERVPQKLMPRIPAGVIGIWESGIRSREDVQRAADCGADAVLVGSALSRADDPELAVRGFTGVQRQGRRG